MRIKDVFERVVVVNLDRRPDRLAAVKAQLDALGVPFERFAAIDGRDPKVARAHARYMAEPLALPEPDRAPIKGYREFYLGNRSDRARTAFYEAREGGKAIATAGAFGLLASMTGVVERALAKKWASVLILEDDVLFHDAAPDLFARAMAEAPRDWRVLQLGAMQLHWEADWIAWHSRHLYRCNGSSFAAHAVGLKREVLQELLDACKTSRLPFDIGALHAIKRRQPARCLTVFPNLAIQDATDSEIGMSRLFFDEARKEDNIYRWRWRDYGLKGLLGRKDQGEAPAPAASENAARVQAPPPPRPHRFGQAPLQPFAGEHPDAAVVVVLLVGLDPAAREPYLDGLARQRVAGEVVPIVVTDDDDFTELRRRRLPFEYLPPEARHKAHAPDLDWGLYRLRRLALWRRKWQPARVLAFGPAAKELLEAWRRSPFETDDPGGDLG